VSKRLGSPYRSGRSRDWVKSKNPKHPAAKREEEEDWSLMKLDKTEIARRQLGTALALFLEDSDPVSVHTLACAGCEIAEHLTRKAGEEPFSTHALLTFPDLDRGKIRRLQNQYWNAFKHAQTRDDTEREDSHLLEHFEDDVNDHTLFVGWYDYALAVRALPIEAQIFQAWYFALYPEKLNPEVDTTKYQRVFPPMLPSKSRADQKGALRKVISSFPKENPEVMKHPQTDARPLMLRRDQ
jgi:hypothetical protein